MSKADAACCCLMGLLVIVAMVAGTMGWIEGSSGNGVSGDWKRGPTYRVGDNK